MRRFTLVWLAVTAFIAGIASYFSYQAGLAQGLAAKLPAGAAGPGWYGFYGPGWGFGFFHLFGFFWFLLFLLLLFGLFRAARFGRWGGGGGHQARYEDRLREWHRHAHEAPPEEKPGT